MKKLLHISVFVISIIISGCLPGPVHYYEPRSSEGELVQTNCGTVLAPKETIEFHYDGVKIQVTGYGNSLRIYLYVPEGVTAKLSSDDILVQNDKRAVTNVMTILKINYFDFDLKYYKALESSDVMLGKTRDLVIGTQPQLFEIRTVGDEGREHYFIQLPSIIINDNEHTFPIIEFTRKSGFGVFPVNC